MAKIHGSAQDDYLFGTEQSDTISGGKGVDGLYGAGGDDTLTGGKGGDWFIFQSGGGHDTVTDFNPGEGDFLVFDFGTITDAMAIGNLSDGFTWNTDSGGTGLATAVDANNDGHTDTLLQVDGIEVTVLGWAPEDLTGQMLLGG